jgi:hypothetical protein
MVSSCSMRWAKKQGKTSSVWVDAPSSVRVFGWGEEPHRNIMSPLRGPPTPETVPMAFQKCNEAWWSHEIVISHFEVRRDMMRPCLKLSECLKLFHNVSHCKERTQRNLMESLKSRPFMEVLAQSWAKWHHDLQHSRREGCSGECQGIRVTLDERWSSTARTIIAGTWYLYNVILWYQNILHRPQI